MSVIRTNALTLRLLCALACPALTAAADDAATSTGPSSSASPYLLPLADGVKTKSLLTVGDAIGGYRMVGIPDGLGFFSNNDGTYTLLMNHELGKTVGIARSHGGKGAFVSRWVINATTGQVISGRDHLTGVDSLRLWDNTGAGNWVSGSGATLDRLCSADLADVGAYASGSLGTADRLFLSGEETDNGRLFAHVASGADAGQSFELASFGKMAFETAVASPFAQAKTVVIAQDDGSVTDSLVAVYVGDKKSTGNAVERAGLAGGSLYGVAVDGMLQEPQDGAPAAGAGTRFSLKKLGTDGNVRGLTSAQLKADAATKGTSTFRRPEDGAWDIRAGMQNNYYFVTTDQFNAPVSNPSQVGRSHLWHFQFDDITNPTAGGKAETLLNGTEGHQMLDNLCMDKHGRIILQEDPGNQPHVAKIWLYDTTSKEFVAVMAHDSTRFVTGQPNFQTQDEESSGVVDASAILGEGWFLLDVQSHAANADAELVQNGQLLAVYLPLTLTKNQVRFDRLKGQAGQSAMPGMGFSMERLAASSQGMAQLRLSQRAAGNLYAADLNGGADDRATALGQLAAGDASNAQNGIFAMGRYGKLEHDANATTGEFDSATYDLLVGFDRQFSAEMTAGIAFSYANVRNDTGGGLGESDANLFGGLLYARFDPQAMGHFDVSGGYRVLAGDTTFHTAAGDNTGSPEGSQWMLNVRYSHPLEVGGNAKLIPFVGASMADTQVDAYTETGPSALAFGSVGSAAYRGQVGVVWEQQISDAQQPGQAGLSYRLGLDVDAQLGSSGDQQGLAATTGLNPVSSQYDLVQDDQTYVNLRAGTSLRNGSWLLSVDGAYGMSEDNKLMQVGVSARYMF